MKRLGQGWVSIAWGNDRWVIKGIKLTMKTGNMMPVRDDAKRFALALQTVGVIDVLRTHPEFAAFRHLIPRTQLARPFMIVQERAYGLRFSELTPARIDLLEALRQCGPCSVYALAKTTGRNYSNVHTDISKLEEHGLVKRTPDDMVFVPFESVEIRLALVKQAA